MKKKKEKDFGICLYYMNIYVLIFGVKFQCTNINIMIIIMFKL